MTDLLDTPGLSPRERLLVHMSVDHSAADLAIRFGVKPGTIRQQLKNARIKSRDQADRERLLLKGGAPDVRWRGLL